MQFGFAEHVHHLLLVDEYILLDEVRDRYVVLGREWSERLSLILADCESDPDGAAMFLNRGLLHARTGGHQFVSTVSSADFGIDNYEWRSTSRFRSDQRELRAFPAIAFAIARSYWMLKRHGLHGALQKLRQLKKTAPSRDVVQTAHAIEKAKIAADMVALCARCLPFRHQCLEASLAASMYLLSARVNVDFKIGVQRYDFLAHAWIEVGGQVIGDDPSLPHRMPTLLAI
jgi:hypothetical protein